MSTAMLIILKNDKYFYTCTIFLRIRKRPGAYLKLRLKGRVGGGGYLLDKGRLIEG